MANRAFLEEKNKLFGELARKCSNEAETPYLGFSVFWTFWGFLVNFWVLKNDLQIFCKIWSISIGLELCEKVIPSRSEHQVLKLSRNTTSLVRALSVQLEKNSFFFENEKSGHFALYLLKISKVAISRDIELEGKAFSGAEIVCI